MRLLRNLLLCVHVCIEMFSAEASVLEMDSEWSETAPEGCLSGLLLRGWLFLQLPLHLVPAEICVFTSSQVFPVLIGGQVPPQVSRLASRRDKSP